MNLKITYVAVAVCLIAGIAAADCNYAHTHIGINPTWRPDWTAPADASLATDPDPTDNNKLWFFSLPPVHSSATPGWPSWEQSDGGTFLMLTQYLDGGEPVINSVTGKELWTCSFYYSKTNGYGDSTGKEHVNGWHSAHGPQGVWNLESVDGNTVPDWDIVLVREGTSLAEEDDFFMLNSDGISVLTADDDEYDLPTDWLEDKTAWGFHVHMSYMFWLESNFDDTVSVTFSAYDEGGVYDRSAEFTINFAKSVCVPVEGDLNGDCTVNLDDFAIFAQNWLVSGIVD